MILKKRIPKEFYKLFRSSNMEAYMLLLVAIYEESSDACTALGLTVEEGQAIIRETIARARIEWQEDGEETEGEMRISSAPSAILGRLVCWGWLKSDFDERLNTYILSFSEYSRLYVELFRRLQNEEDSRERESLLSIYSALYTYHSDGEKNNDILKNALRISRSLGQLLSNMQDGMRTYFDELSGRKDFIGIQQVLVEEINNSDSEKYAILTTTDSFYRYKEGVRELMSLILDENERKALELKKKQREGDEISGSGSRWVPAVRYCEEAAALVHQIGREFDLIERKYNRLVEQKAVFARRALARIHYIFQEGTKDEDSVLKLLALIGRDPENEDILRELRDKTRLTTQFRRFDDSSLYSRREGAENRFEPLTIEAQGETEERDIAEFVPKPLYTRRQLREFCAGGMKNGSFIATEDTVRSVEDLEKLLFLWQEMTGDQERENVVALGKELKGEEGFTFSELTIDMRKWKWGTRDV